MAQAQDLVTTGGAKGRALADTGKTVQRVADTLDRFARTRPTRKTPDTHPALLDFVPKHLLLFVVL